MASYMTHQEQKQLWEQEQTCHIRQHAAASGLVPVFSIFRKIQSLSRVCAKHTQLFGDFLSVP